MPAVTDFRLYHGNDLEVLAGVLAAELAKPVAGGALLAPETILVPQPAVRRWLQKVLAERHGVAANLRFLAPGQFVKLALDANVASDDAAVGDATVLRWRVWEQLADPALPLDPRFAPVASLLARDDDPAAAWALAGELAAAFEKYQAWRRDWLRHWDRGGAPDDWQAELWRRATRGLAHRGRRLDAYLARFGDPDAAGDASHAAHAAAIPQGLPARTFVFACQHVSPDVLRVIASAARAGPLHFFFLSPVAGWWGDLRTARERLRDDGRHDAAEPGAFADDDENPLLRANGAAGRDFVRLLFGYEAAHPTFEHAAYAPPDPERRTGVLHDLQRDLLARRPPPARGTREFAPQAAITGTTEGAATPVPSDASLQVHACPTRLREVQVLHEQLRALLEADPTLRPRDIVVLAADIDAYAPYVRAVFEAADEGGNAPIPYALADGRPLARHPLVAAFAGLLALPAARFGINEVLDLLALPAVAERADLAAADLDALRDALAAAGVRWGLHAEHRAALGEPHESAFTWAWGLDRLLLGHASGGDADLAGIAPLPRLDGGGLALIDRLLPLLRRLAYWQRALATPRAPPAWGEALAQLLADVFPERPRELADRQALDDLRAALARLPKEAAQAGVARAVPLEVVRAWLAAALDDGDARAPLLTGGVSFGRMVPMRLVPFPVVCLLGMNDGEFPRRDPPGGLNRLAAALGGRDRQAGDRSVRDDDRGLFLQLFAAAGRVFYASFLGQDLRSGEALPPSVVVSELIDAAAAYYADPARVRRDFVVAHPLQPFSPAAVGGIGAMPADPRRFTYRRDWAEAAAIAADGTPRAPPAAFAAGLPQDAAPPASDWTRDELVAALKRPAREFLQARLGVRVPGTAARLAEDEPFDTDEGLARWQLDERLVELALAADDRGVDALAARLLAEGRVAPGASGHAAVRGALGRVAPVLAAWRGAPARAQAWSLALDGGRLAGAHARVNGDGLRQFSASQAHGATVLALGIDALAWWATGETGPVVRATLGCPPQVLPPLPADVAHGKLARLLALAARARREPLPFAPRAALAFLQAAPDKALRAAADAWGDAHGEGASPWVRLALRGDEPFAARDDAPTLAFMALARDVFDGLPGVAAAASAPAVEVDDA